MRNRTLLALVLCALGALSARAASPAPESDEQKTLYALGLSMARNLAPFSLTEADLEVLKEGLSDGVLGHSPKVPLEAYGPKIQGLAEKRLAATAEVEKKSAAEFLKKAAAEKGSVRTDSGLIMTEITPGQGDHPTATNKVKVHYRGTLRDGKVFDSSIDRGTPATFALNQVIPCWTEALQRMAVGGKAKLVCPSELAYKDRGAPPLIKPGAALVFEVELLEIVK